MTEGPFKSAFDADTDGAIRREITTYRMKNGMMVKESEERTIDNYVKWARQQQITLPAGHIFHRALWVKLAGSKPDKPFIPTEVPFTVNKNGSVSLGKYKFWLNHIFTLYADIDAPAEEE